MPSSRRSASGPRSVHEAGFTIIESLIALGLVFGVLVELLASLNTAVRGVTTGRQRGVPNWSSTYVCMQPG